MATMRTVVPFLIVAFSSAFVWSGIAHSRGSFDEGLCASNEATLELPALSLVTTPEVTQKSTDPYEGWQQWCEPYGYDIVCKDHDDCEGVYPNHPAQRPMRCFNPWYAKKNPEYEVCAPGYARNLELEWRKNRLREIVRQQYFGETEYCALDGRPIHKENWKCQRATRQGDKLTNFLLIPYDRETSRRPWKRHRLEVDLRANRTAWFRHANVYGWEPIKNEKGHFVRMEKIDEEASPYYNERHRWHYGLGPFGQNVALYLRYWDKQAPPEILCREGNAVETYLRNARRILKNLKNGIRCNGEYYEDKNPTWEIVHRAASSGKICPSTGLEKNAKKMAEKVRNFRIDAREHGIDPEEVVTLEMLGRPIAEEDQNARMAEIYSAVEYKWPVEKM